MSNANSSKIEKKSVIVAAFGKHLFGVLQTGLPPRISCVLRRPMTSPASSSATAPSLQVEVLPDHLQFPTDGQASVLESGLHAGVELPSSCRNGTCRECMCRLLSGSVRYRVEWPGLSADEKADGWFLPCVALAQTDLRIEQPFAQRL